MQIAFNTHGISTSLSPMDGSAAAKSGQAASGHLSLTFGSGDKAKETAGTKAPSTTSDVFAAEIMRRINLAEGATVASNAAIASNASLGSNAGAGVNAAASGDLQAALADAVEYVRKQHGDAAATAVMGIMFKEVGDGSGGEDRLGDALVSALKFIDGNFGIAAGDAAMAKFNGALNEAVNDYYQNGHLEEFYAANGATGAVKQAQGVVSSTLAHVAKAFGTDAAQTVADILATNFTDQGSTRQGLSQAIVAANDYLSANYGAADLGSLPLGQTNQPKGSVLNLTA
ncbi:hypothetical protein [Solidesulfovibrio magneticus]|uniref:Uncharacterized protein n=1 Tax=Solidesulfovibrio magneticus (strain ATCC 700980 / DSM 13731 / RS-1) TaxID=573370 RepID=C4XL99_SOLM1|nr:hypothetical protein [Solidesulfovibrio magneticus]BAH77038.1 hypothetical protein DMR_35470 [Solidesulfovibrio magneticus RS-1]